MQRDLTKIPDSVAAASQELGAIAHRNRTIGKYWNMLSSIRHMYQVASVPSHHGVEMDFLLRKLCKVPCLCHPLARSEQQAIDALAGWYQSRGRPEFR